jgi:hypothetical protein
LSDESEHHVEDGAVGVARVVEARAPDVAQSLPRMQKRRHSSATPE